MIIIEEPKPILTERHQDYAEIYLFGVIGRYGDISSKEFIRALIELEREYEDIRMNVNCFGGDVYEGNAIYNHVLNSRRTINSYIVGVAASFGAIIPQATKKIYMSKYARYMTHAARVSCLEVTADEMEHQIKLIRGLDTDMAERLATRTKKTVEQAKAEYINPMDKWFNAKDAKDEGLVDEVYNGIEIDVPETIVNPLQVYNYYDNVIAAKMQNNGNSSTTIII